jgi:hypothetical protein
LVHGCLTTKNILFDLDHYIQIVDFRARQLEIVESESEEGTQLGRISGERLTPENDFEAFASILFEIVVGRPTNGEASIPANIPTFISTIIQSGLWWRSKPKCSF